MTLRRGYPFLAMANLLAGGFLVVATFAFTDTTVATLGWTVSVGVGLFGLTMAVLGFRASALSERIGIPVIGLLTAALATWTIVAANLLEPGVARWVVFTSGCLHIGLSLVSLVFHEVTTQRVVHHLEVEAHRESTAGVS